MSDDRNALKRLVILNGACAATALFCVITFASIRSQESSSSAVAHNPELFSNPSIAKEVGPLLLKNIDLLEAEKASLAHSAKVTGIVVGVGAMLTYLVNIRVLMRYRRTVADAKK
jgi:hypothetical protein